jgi:hypothetical protein
MFWWIWLSVVPIAFFVYWPKVAVNVESLEHEDGGGIPSLRAAKCVARHQSNEQTKFEDRFEVRFETARQNRQIETTRFSQIAELSARSYCVTRSPETYARLYDRRVLKNLPIKLATNNVVFSKSHVNFFLNDSTFLWIRNWFTGTVSLDFEPVRSRVLTYHSLIPNEITPLLVLSYNNPQDKCLNQHPWKHWYYRPYDFLFSSSLSALT